MHHNDFDQYYFNHFYAVYEKIEWKYVKLKDDQVIQSPGSVLFFKHSDDSQVCVAQIGVRLQTSTPAAGLCNLKQQHQFMFLSIHPLPTVLK